VFVESDPTASPAGEIERANHAQTVSVTQIPKTLFVIPDADALARATPEAVSRPIRPVEGVHGQPDG
jgi:hypothetical protein